MSKEEALGSLLEGKLVHFLKVLGKSMLKACVHTQLRS